MSVVWIVTTGNSDVKLLTDKDFSFLKDTSVKEDLLGSCYTKFKPIKNDKDDWSLPARVMGIVYGDVISEHWHKLKFPLLDGFYQQLQKDKVKPDRVIVLLTDQSAIFEDSNVSDSPYWKDTCTLQPIFENYFRQKKIKKIEFSILEPNQTQQGLDDWSATLDVVKAQFVDWENKKWISRSDQVIVSHQAGTPAISSAVQIISLLRFGKKVKFLVSSELHSDQTKLIEGSSYFDTLQIKKLQDLLARNDYAGVTSVVDSLDLEDSVMLNHLLQLAELWNAAKFDEFAQKMGQEASVRSTEWWWKGYEMAYLAVVRMKNGDPTEALFHSVRAIEGLICEWAINTHSVNIHYRFCENTLDGKIKIEYDFRRFRGQREGSPTAKSTIAQTFRNALENPKQKESLDRNTLGLYGRVLYTLFKSTFEPNSLLKDHPIKIVWEQLADERNELFHRLRGMSPQEVYEAWGTTSKEQWSKVLLDCLNLVTGQSFVSLKSASLMAQVHKELEAQIEKLQLP
jgi:hypothetical protein